MKAVIFVYVNLGLLLGAGSLVSASAPDSVPFYFNETFARNPEDASEFCVAPDPAQFYECPQGYVYSGKVKRVYNMDCRPEGAKADEMRQSIENCDYARISNNMKHPICISAPKECVRDPKMSARGYEYQDYPGDTSCPTNPRRRRNLMGMTFRSPVEIYEKNIYFEFLTSADNFQRKTIRIGDFNELLTQGFIPGADTKIISHGFLSSSSNGPGKALTNAYIQRHAADGGKPINIILVDWSAFTGRDFEKSGFFSKMWESVKERTGIYAKPAIYHWPAGVYVAEVVEFIVTCAETPLDKIHLIGHSLGAHVQGMAGRYFQERGLGKVGRITALDPAAPCFIKYFPFKCFPESEQGFWDPVHRTDADFVDVIHTNGKTYGLQTANGHADFYPNGGLCQPGCNMMGNWCLPFESCSHSRSIELMADSVNAPETNFASTRCSSAEDATKEECSLKTGANMGEYCDKKARGIFYLKTNSESPFKALPVPSPNSSSWTRRSWDWVKSFG